MRNIMSINEIKSQLEWSRTNSEKGCELEDVMITDNSLYKRSKQMINFTMRPDKFKKNLSIKDVPTFPSRALESAMSEQNNTVQNYYNM